MTARSASKYIKNFAFLDEFNMYIHGYSKKRMIDYHLDGKQFTDESFTLTAADKALLNIPSFGDIDRAPFATPLQITPKAKESGTRIDFGVTVVPNYGTDLKIFGTFRPDRRYRNSSTAPEVYDRKKGISHKEFIEWLGDIQDFEVFLY
jgi:hypothetical protein